MELGVTTLSKNESQPSKIKSRPQLTRATLLQYHLALTMSIIGFARFADDATKAVHSVGTGDLVVGLP